MKLSREKKRKQQKNEKNENVTETHELVLSNNWMEKEDNKRRDQTLREKQKEIKQKDVKTRRDQKKKWIF